MVKKVPKNSKKKNSKNGKKNPRDSKKSSKMIQNSNVTLQYPLKLSNIPTTRNYIEMQSQSLYREPHLEFRVQLSPTLFAVPRNVSSSSKKSLSKQIKNQNKIMRFSN